MNLNMIITIMWGLAGILVLSTNRETVSKFQYMLTWLVLMANLAAKI